MNAGDAPLPSQRELFKALGPGPSGKSHVWRLLGVVGVRLPKVAFDSWMVLVP